MASRGSKIYPSDFNDLLNLLNIECNRRNNNGPGTASFSRSVSTGATIYEDAAQTIYQKLVQITGGNQVVNGGGFSGSLNNRHRSDQIDAATLNQYQNTVSGLTSVGYYSSPSGCASGCMGLCTGCTGSCSAGCTGSCQGSCQNSCQGSCTGCGAECESSCHGECMGCSNAVSQGSGECPDSCANSCWGGAEY